MHFKQKVTVTIDETIVRDIDRLSKEMNETRSHLVEEALKTWRRGQMERELMSSFNFIPHPSFSFIPHFFRVKF